MNKCLFTGKIYNMKDNGKSGKDANVNFRLAVRKPFVSDADKQNNEYNHFLTVNGWGPRAEQLGRNFKDGDFISVDVSWDPYKKDGNDVPQFRLNDWYFPAGVQNNGGSSGNGGGSSRGSRDDDDRGSRRDDRRDDRDDRGSRRDDRSSRRSREEDEPEAPPRRGGRRGSDDGGDDNTPF